MKYAQYTYMSNIGNILSFKYYQKQQNVNTNDIYWVGYTETYMQTKYLVVHVNIQKSIKWQI